MPSSGTLQNCHTMEQKREGLRGWRVMYTVRITQKLRENGPLATPHLEDSTKSVRGLIVSATGLLVTVTPREFLTVTVYVAASSNCTSDRMSEAPSAAGILAPFLYH